MHENELLGLGHAGNIFVAMKMARWMSQQNTMAWETAKRCARYLLDKQSLVQSFVTQLPVDTIMLRVDSDHAGCLRTRRSTTCIAVDHGKHVIKHRRRHKRRSRLSTGESEFYAIVRGTALALGMKNMANDYGHEVKVALETDSLSGRGMSP